MTTTSRAVCLNRISMISMRSDTEHAATPFGVSGWRLSMLKHQEPFVTFRRDHARFLRQLRRDGKRSVARLVYLNMRAAAAALRMEI